MKNISLFLFIFISVTSLYYFNSREQWFILDSKYYFVRLNICMIIIALAQHFLQVRTSLTLLIITSFLAFAFQYMILMDQLSFTNYWFSVSLSLKEYIFEFRPNYYWIFFALHFSFGYSLYTILIKLLFKKIKQRKKLG